MRINPSISGAAVPSGPRGHWKLIGILVAVTAFLGSLAEIVGAFWPADPQSIVVEPPVVVIAPPPDRVVVPDPPMLPETPVSGSWDLQTTVERTTYRPFDGLRCIYRLNLLATRDGKVSGSGELWSENGEEVSGLNHLLMSLSGHVEGEGLQLTYELAGRERPSTGALYLTFDRETGAWSGRFDSTVAASSGSAQLMPR